MLAHEAKAARAIAGFSTDRAGATLGMTGEAYRVREKAGRFSGAQLALLAHAYGRSLADAFPSYQPSEGEILLCRQLAA